MGVAGKGHALWLLPGHRISLEHPGAAPEAVSQPQRPAQLQFSMLVATASVDLVPKHSCQAGLGKTFA